MPTARKKSKPTVEKHRDDDDDDDDNDDSGKDAMEAAFAEVYLFSST